jgi:hypothetical protein
LIRQALDAGLNFLDNSWDYHDGESEVRMGKALRDGYRQKAYLMTNFDGRTKGEAMKQFDESLKRFQTDHVDLLQFHEVIRFDDPNQFFSPGGAGGRAPGGKDPLYRFHGTQGSSYTCRADFRTALCAADRRHREKDGERSLAG